MTHLIRRQYLEVEYSGDESQALVLQRRLSALYYQNLLPAIERTLDNYSSQNVHLQIDQLTIDAGSINLNRLEHDLAESVARELDKSLKDLPLSPARTKRTTPQESAVDAFLYFLRTGTLPWSFKLPAGRTLEELLLQTWQQQEQMSLSSSSISAICWELRSPTQRNRMIKQFSANFLAALLIRLQQEALHPVQKLQTSTITTAIPSQLRKQLAKEIWNAAFYSVATGNSVVEQEIVLKAWIAVSESASELVEWRAEIQRSYPEAAKQLEAAADPGDSRKTGPAPEAAQTIGSTTAPEPAKSSNRYPDAEDGLFIENAGLVLLHPFLPRFLEVIGAAEEDTLRQPERALCTLHYLATGQITAPEYRLTLPKLLCGIPLETPVEADVNLTTAEEQEATTLLEAVIRHWGVLGDSSPDALRGTYLRRPGKLTRRFDGDWLLKAENQTWDILLDRLPWSYAAIKLPWMSTMLWVEWR